MSQPPQHNFTPQGLTENIIVKTISEIGYDGYGIETDLHILCAIATVPQNIKFWDYYFDKVLSVFIQVNNLIYLKCFERKSNGL